MNVQTDYQIPTKGSIEYNYLVLYITIMNMRLEWGISYAVYKQLV
jgi:hypothetical protein